jgi:hypothetical protein
MEKEMKENNPVSRKKFLWWGAAFSSLLAIPAFLLPSKKNKPAETVKMLSQDGKLVEIDISHISAKKGKLKDRDIHTWVRNKTKNANPHS